MLGLGSATGLKVPAAAPRYEAAAAAGGSGRKLKKEKRCCWWVVLALWQLGWPGGGLGEAGKAAFLKKKQINCSCFVLVLDECSYRMITGLPSVEQAVE